jgi:CheY-like chemotaxis protein
MDVQPLEGVRVLVVEDDDDTREMMSCLLEESGALVTSAGCVAEAFAVFVGQKPNVVVSDIGLPGKSGYDLVSRIRSLPPQLGRDTPIIAVSAGRPVRAGGGIEATAVAPLRCAAGTAPRVSGGGESLPEAA